MASLGELYFALGLDDKQFNDSLEAAKEKIASLEKRISLKVEADTESLQKSLSSLKGKDITPKIDKSAIEAQIAGVKKSLEDLELKISKTSVGSKLSPLLDQRSTLETQRASLESQLKNLSNVSESIEKNAPSVKIKLELTNSEVSRIKSELKSSLFKSGVDVTLNPKITKRVMRNNIKAALDGLAPNITLTPVIPKKNLKKLELEVNKSVLRNSVVNALKNQTFKAKLALVVNKAEVQDAIRQAFAQQSLIWNTTPSDVRTARVQEIQSRSAARELLDQEKLNQLRNKGLDTSTKKAKGLMNFLTKGSTWATELGNQIGNAFSIYAIERFVRQLYTVGGEFQKQQIALRNMIGDAQKADVVFERIKDLSVVSPFTFSELASYTKQMAAYGVEYEELYDTTKRLADISAGVGVDMSRLILAYGQVRSAEVLRGQELRQFTEAGIPIVAELAKRLEEVRGKSVAVGEVFDAISKREISFGMVKDVLFDMTDPGGRFFEMQEELATSLAGKWSNLRDAWDIMIADMANGSNTTLAGMAELTAIILRNWESWIPALAGIVAALGTFRTVMAVVIPLQQAFNIATKANPYIALASLIIGAGAAIYGYATNVKTATQELKELNLEIDKNIQKNKEKEQTAYRYLETLKSENTSEERRLKLYQELEKMYRSVFESMGYEKTMLEDLITLKERVADATKKQSLAEYDNAIIKNQQEIDRLRREDFKRLTTPGRADKHSQNDTRIKELESINAGLRENQELLREELDWKSKRDSLNTLSTLQDYLDVYGEIGKAVKVLKDAGINGTLASPEKGKDFFEYARELRSALSEQERIMEDFDPTSNVHKNAASLVKIYKNAIKAIDGVIPVNKEDEKAEKEAEKAAKKAGEEAAKAFAEGVKEEMSRIASQWDLYKQLFEMTGNKEFARTAFNLTPVWDDAAVEMYEEFKDKVNQSGISFDISDTAAKEMYGELYDSWKAIKDRIENNAINIKINAAKSYESTMSLDEKLKSLEAQRDEELSQYREEDPMYFSVLEKWENEIRKVKGEIFGLSPEFKALLVDTTAMGVSEMTRLYKAAAALKGYIDQNRTKTHYENGNVIGYDYTKTDGTTGYIPIDDYEKLGNVMGKTKKKASEVQIAFEELWSWISGEDANKDGEADKKFVDVADSLAVLSKEVAATIDSFSDMFDALGNEDLADNLSFVSDMFSGIGNIAEGIASGNPLSVLSGITGIITSIAQHHDKKLDRAIEKSALKVKKLENAYKNLESVIAYQLGSVTSKQSEEMLNNLIKQRDELYRQYNAEDDKKKTDKSKLEDYKQQIHELEVEIKQFYENLAKDQYNADVKDWAKQLSEAIVGAFATGEDAAQAFDNTVGDILRSLATDAIRLQFIEPAMSNLREYMFGSQGIFTKESANGTDLSASEISGLAAELEKLKSQINQSNDYWDKINKATGGLLDEAESSSSGLSKGIESVTEDTANLLASYINGIRGDVSVKRVLIEKLITEDMPQMSYIAQAQLQELNQIASNTKRNADAADRIYDLVNRVVDKGSNKLKV